jgi:hypothetical protein
LEGFGVLEFVKNCLVSRIVISSEIILIVD